MSSRSLAAVLGASDAVLFDFDGPICDVFRGLPAPQVADELADLFAAMDPSLADRARATDDPMEVHRLSQDGDGGLLALVESALTDAEVRAVKVAGPPVSGAAAALTAARDAGRHVAVVSNNSEECVRAYLEIHGLADGVEAVIGRPVLRPDLMKPAPYPLLRAAECLGVEAAQLLLIGDSTTDIEAARAAGARSVGYANKPPKRLALAEAGADAVVVDMQVVADALASLTA